MRVHGHAVFGWSVAAVSMAVLFVAAGLTGVMARDPRQHWHRWARTWSRFALRVIGVRVVVEDAERLERLMRGGPIILASNHQSMLDIAILLAVLPGYFGFLSKVEVFEIPLLGWAADLFGCIPIKRGDRHSATEALQHARGALREGRTVLFFPEGTRTHDGNLGHFKRGAMLLARTSGVPVLPLAIRGSYDLMSRHTWLGRPGTVTLFAGRLAAPPPNEAAVEASTDALHDEVQRLLERPEPLEPVAVEHESLRRELTW